MSCVYLLLCDKNTYVGATVNLDRRLRQHNKEIKGGAHATSAKVAKGGVWEVAIYVSGFPDWQAALQFEWRWKQISRKVPSCIDPLEKRIMALKELLLLDKPTSKAKLYSEWENPPQVHLEIERAKNLYT